MRWWLAAAVVVVIVLAATMIFANTGDSGRFDQQHTFPPDRWGKKPRAATDPKRKWVTSFVPAVRDTLHDAGMPPAVGIAQAAVETGWGSAGRNNPWGIRGAGDAGSDYITTKEELEPGVKVTQTNQKFARFSSLQAAARGYASFLSGKSYRPGWPLRQRDVGRWLLWLWGMGYATAGSYATAVVDASRRIAVELDDPTLAIPWTPAHAQIAKTIGAAKAGTARRTITRELLEPALGSGGVA